jgi:hypothetical protein
MADKGQEDSNIHRSRDDMSRTTSYPHAVSSDPHAVGDPPVVSTRPSAPVPCASTASAFNAVYDDAVRWAMRNSPDLVAREIRTCREEGISHSQRWLELFRTNYSFVGGRSLVRELICQHLAECEQAGVPIAAPRGEPDLASPVPLMHGRGRGHEPPDQYALRVG